MYFTERRDTPRSLATIKCVHRETNCAVQVRRSSLRQHGDACADGDAREELFDVVVFERDAAGRPILRRATAVDEDVSAELGMLRGRSRLSIASAIERPSVVVIVPREIPRAASAAFG